MVSGVETRPASQAGVIKRGEADVAELTPVARQYRRRRLRLVVVLSVLLLLAGGGLGYFSDRFGWDAVVTAGDEDGPRAWVGSALILVGLAIEIWGLIRGVRRGQGKARWNSPLLGLPREHRRGLRDQVRGRIPTSPESLPLARYLAQATIRDFQYLAPIIAGLSMISAGQLLSHRMSLAWLLTLLGPLILVPGLVWGRRDVRRAETFLSTHPETFAN